MGLFSKKSAPQPSARPEYIEVGQIVNTHGVRGEVKVQPWDVSPELLCGFKTFYMDGAPFRPTSKRVQGDMVLMKLPEVDDMDAAAALKRKVLSIRRNDVQLKPGEHFDAEIIGMNVYNYFPHVYRHGGGCALLPRPQALQGQRRGEDLSHPRGEGYLHHGHRRGSA